MRELNDEYMRDTLERLRLDSIEDMDPEDAEDVEMRFGYIPLDRSQNDCLRSSPSLK